MGRLSVRLLGTGTSTGVPVIGCSCRVCTSPDPRDHRMRCSAYVVANTPGGPVHLLIDAGPDFRQQALLHRIAKIDAVLVTHHHFDHVVGLDDLRPYFFTNPAEIPLYTSDSTAEVLDRAFPYLFEEGSYPGVARLSLRRVTEPFVVQSRYIDASVSVEPIEALHGKMPVLGFRVGRFAYLTDVSRIPAGSLEQLQGLEVLILDALRREPHQTHLSLDEAVELARQIGARETYFIHMTHSVLHAEEDGRLPAGINLGYDGLQLDIEG